MLRLYLCNNKVIFSHDALNLIHSSMYEGLGYAGFTITARNALGQMAYKTVGRGKSTDLETLLVQTFPGKMSHGLQDHIMEGILGHPVSINVLETSISSQISIYTVLILINVPALNALLPIFKKLLY